MTVKLVKKSAVKGTVKAATGGGGGVKAGDFVLIDNENDTCTVVGVDAGGNQADITAIATLAVTSSDPTVLTVDAPVGMTFKMTATGKVGKVTITATATWNDGSVGPFVVVLPVDVQTGGPTGILIVPGTPTVNTP